MAEKQPIKEQIKKLTDQIEAGIKALFQSGDLEKYQAYLRTMSHFHHYSVNNQMLISRNARTRRSLPGIRNGKISSVVMCCVVRKAFRSLRRRHIKSRSKKKSSTPIRNCHCWMQTAIQSRKKKKSRFRCSVRSRFLM